MAQASETSNGEVAAGRTTAAEANRTGSSLHAVTADDGFLGLEVSRFFTRDGVHPYDEVEWELRDAVITNWRDGSLSFEQRGVEFPSTWSMNATTIVAQKYFRGQLGTPQRERSVKQMIDRVADTITAWGVEDGYFADQASAEHFGLELKHLLVNQKMAFNSPVWFNVGVEERPQCSACQPWHALVSTPDGYIPIGRIVDEDLVGLEVFDSHGTTRVVATKDNGVKRVFRVELRNGTFVEATGDHVVRAVAERRNEPAWLRVDQLRPGTRMHLHAHRATEGPGSADEMAVSEAALAGWLQADGFVGQYDHGTNRSLTIEFIVANDDERAWIKQHLDVVFPHVHRKERPVDRRPDMSRIRLYGEQLRPFVERYGLLDRRHDIRVPEVVWTAPTEVVVAYLRSVWQSEGFVTIRGSTARLGFAVISERWTEDLQLLLLRLGIYSRRYRKREARSDRSDQWQIDIGYLSERRRFAERVGFIGWDKQDRLDATLSMHGKTVPDLREEEIVAIVDLGEQRVYDIQTESGEYLSNSIVVHNCFILAVEDTMASILNWYVEEGIIFKGGSGSGVNLSTIRSSKEHLSGGGEPSGPVSFMRGADASAGTIRSGGKTRRAAKMVVLNVDHPDVEEFIWCKAREERKIRVLRESGFDMDLDSPDYASIQYQNANNSVRVTDEFMRAWEADAEYDLRAVTTGDVLDRKRARDVMRQIAQAGWECADPGMQYDTTINRWHTCPESGRINASNPCCFVGATMVETEHGLVRFDVLEKMARAGEGLPRVRSYDRLRGQHVLRPANHVWVAGWAPFLVEVVTVDGLTLRCTPEHRFLTSGGDYVQAQDLQPGTALRAVDAGGDRVDHVAGVLRVDVDEPVVVFDMEVQGTHNFAVTDDAHSSCHGVLVSNSEYMHLDNSACNLASLNLKKFYDYEADRFDVEAYQRAVELTITAQEIIVGHSSYPTDKIRDNAIAFRELGLGYANLGGLLMSLGLPYDSDEGRSWCSALTALMTGHAYRTSAEISKVTGPFAGYPKNASAMLKVIEMHGDEVEKIDPRPVPGELLGAAKQAWKQAYDLGARYGFRNSQASVTAPTGTISFLMDCDTTGIEPDLGLVKTKKLVGGGSMSIVNQTVPQALRRLGYNHEQVEAIVAHIDQHRTIAGAPAIRDEHLPVFSCAMGDNAIHYMGHVKMMAAAQPFISGAISKCVTAETLVASEDGLVRIGSLYDGEAPVSFRDHRMAVASLEGVQKTDAFYYGGVRPVREVQLRSGHRLVGTPNHRLLVATDAGLRWKMLCDLEPGDHVAVQYGSDLWSAVPARLDDFAPSARYGWQQDVRLPREMTEDLAFLLGAYAAEGHTSESDCTVSITSPVGEVLERVAGAWREVFGVEAKIVRPADRCPSVAVASRIIVEFLAHLGCGRVSSEKRMPDAVLRSPKAMVLAFLQGLALDADGTWADATPKWGLCLNAPALLDDLQAVLTNLGIVHGRNSTLDRQNGRTYEEVYASGEQAQALLRLFPFLEPDKRARAEQLLVADPSQSTADVVPGITPRELYELIPAARSNRVGDRDRSDFAFLCDPRTQHVSRRTLERVSVIPGVELPDWLLTVLTDDLHFSPVTKVGDAGDREVYDVSVPTTHAFVGNGIVNHNTVNMPEETTVEEVEQLFYDAWKLGIKAIAIYRDNCKVAQPLAITKTAQGGEQVGEVGAVQVLDGMIRRKLPKQRPSQTISFRVADAEGYLTAGEYPGDGLGEIFVKLGKQGSTLSGVMDAFAISVSLGLQYGVPLEAYVQKFMNMRFEPAGLTDDDEIRFATSIVDYIARKLAIEYLPSDKRAELGVFTTGERTAALDNPYGTAGPTDTVAQPPTPATPPSALPAAQAGTSSVPYDADAPLCYACGTRMTRAGSCHVCQQCGATSGCS
ncbi:MAG TPA: LAGLIDADG family homing endonuclease [Nitriliruptorales bacterium]|nr:LAGLIDADG family homing endonuclease [Nitriliruptorales bacterium]